MRSVRAQLEDALKAYYSGMFEGPEPFGNKIAWIKAAVDSGFLDEGTHPRSYSNGLKRLEIGLEEPVAKGKIDIKRHKDQYRYDEENDTYMFFSRPVFSVAGEDVREMKRCYTNKPNGLGYTINQVCKHFSISRKDFGFIRTALGWTHDQDEFTDEEHALHPVDDLLNDRVQQSRWLLDQADKEKRLRELEARARAWEEWERHEQAAEKSKPIDIQLDTGEPNGLRVAVVMLADLHIGEGGEHQAKRILSRCLQALQRAYSEADKVVLCFGGDLFHADTFNGTTTKGTYVSHMDPFDMLALTYGFLDGLLGQTDPKRTQYVVIAGNHDRMATGHLVNWMRTKGYALNAAPYEVGVVRAGENMVFGFVHGDLHRGKPEAILMEMIETGLWAGRPWRAVYMGHKHHKKAQSFQTFQVDTQGTLFLQVASPNTHRGLFERQQGYLSGHGIQVDVWSDMTGKTAEFIY